MRTMGPRRFSGAHDAPYSISAHLGQGERQMWYFAWILGVLLACSCGIVNALWLETTQNLDEGDAGDR